jgi:1-aminocyclopropane-1-carboxylate deaminase
MSLIDYGKIRVDPVSSLYNFHTTTDVLRLDLVHSVISGNKLFKLQGYLDDAKQKGSKALLTFGGAFSNHILATAAAAKLAGLGSIGVIRGEASPNLSPTLKDAKAHGMHLLFVDRSAYRSKSIPASAYEIFSPTELYCINEGGYGPRGAEGASTILDEIDATTYTHIIAAVGTGTMVAGLTLRCNESQTVIGIPVLKSPSLQEEIEALLPEEKRKSFLLLHDYHFGGYAKYSKELIDFMNDWYEHTSIPSDFVYTGKIFYALHQLFQKNWWPSKSKVLVIHSGGLQGNRSLPKGTLIF